MKELKGHIDKLDAEKQMLYDCLNEVVDVKYNNYIERVKLVMDYIERIAVIRDIDVNDYDDKMSLGDYDNDRL